MHSDFLSIVITSGRTSAGSIHCYASSTSLHLTDAGKTAFDLPIFSSKRTLPPGYSAKAFGTAGVFFIILDTKKLGKQLKYMGPSQRLN
ncbi:unnamed protein product, partial [Vitis vinifera]